MSRPKNNQSKTPTNPKGETFPIHEHRPQFKFAQLMSLREGFICESCEEPLRFTKKWYIVSRVWYYIFLGFLIYSVLSQKDPGSEAMVRNFITIIVSLVVYLIVAAVIHRMATYEIDERIQEAKAAAEARLTAQKTAEQASTTPLTAEQEELQALYKHYEELNSNKSAEDSAVFAEMSAQPVTEAAPKETVDEIPTRVKGKEEFCVHEVGPGWRNYLAGTMEFDCAKCGKRISFTAQVRRSYNLVLMSITLLMLIPMLMMEKVSFSLYFLITLGVLVLATIVQYLLVKKAPKE